MKRLLLFAPFLLAARAADSDHLAEGQWESLFQIESSSTDGKKQHQQTAPIYPPSRCVKGGETAPMAFFSHPEDPDCKTVSLKAEKGKIRLTRLCQSASNPMATIEAKGHYDPHHYSMTFLMWNMFDGVKIAVKGHITGSHQGLCPPNKTQ